MKLLPKKIDIEKARLEERKRQIDEGIHLAKKIDALRQTALSEEKALREWRKNSLAAVQKEIDDYIIVKENLRVQTEEAEVHRKKLIEPLDKEWEEINRIKSELNRKNNL